MGSGFQWVDGSFVEDCENYRGRSPGDIDVVTFYLQSAPDPKNPDLPRLTRIVANRAATKATFRTDHILVRLDWPAARLVDDVRYWAGLFSHRRGDDVWKGMLRIDLDTPADDTAAEQYLAAAALATP